MINQEEPTEAEKEKILAEFVIALSKQVRANTGDINTLLQHSKGVSSASGVEEIVNFDQRLKVLEQKTDEICSFINHLIMSTANGAWENETWTKH